jgi:hypothetical protein
LAACLSFGALQHAAPAQAQLSLPPIPPFSEQELADLLPGGRANLITLQRVIIWQHASHPKFVLPENQRLSALCRKRGFNQRYLRLFEAKFGGKYQLGIAWRNPNLLVDPGNLAKPGVVYYFWRDGGLDGYVNCTVYEQVVDVPTESTVQ